MGEGISKSLQIFLHKLFFISLCLGTEEVLFFIKLIYRECFPPSRLRMQLLLSKYLIKSMRFKKQD